MCFPKERTFVHSLRHSQKLQTAYVKVRGGRHNMEHSGNCKPVNKAGAMWVSGETDKRWGWKYWLRPGHDQSCRLVSYTGGFGFTLKDNKQALEQFPFFLIHSPLLTPLMGLQDSTLCSQTRWKLRCLSEDEASSLPLAYVSVPAAVSLTWKIM